MEYQVPQFIEVEDKVVGPLTLKQFIYLAGGTGICVISFIYLPIWLAIVISAPLAGFAIALAFYKINGKPFIAVVESAFTYYTSTKLFLWKHEDAKQSAKPAATTAPALPRSPTGGRLTSSKLHELAWSLDIKKPDGQK